MKPQNEAVIKRLLYEPDLKKIRGLIDYLKAHDADKNNHMKLMLLICYGITHPIDMFALEEKVEEAEGMLKTIKKGG